MIQPTAIKRAILYSFGHHVCSHRRKEGESLHLHNDQGREPGLKVGLAHLRSNYWLKELALEALPKTLLARVCPSLKWYLLGSAIPRPPSDAFWRGFWLTLPGATASLDDLLAHAADFKSANLRDIFHAIRRPVCLLTKKCHLFRWEMSLLGHAVSAAEMSTYRAKVATVRDLPVPHNVRELQSFLGQISYYGKFPLYLLTQKSYRHSSGVSLHCQLM